MIQILWIVGLSFTVLILLFHFGFVRKKSNLSKFTASVQFSNRQKWIFKITILSMIVLMITGANAVIFSAQHLTGLGLLIHLSFAPIFAIGLAILVFQWAHVFQFVEGKEYTLSIKILFWALAVLVLPVVLSIVLSMHSFFGTEAQYFLSDLHRVSSLFLVIAAILFLYFIIINRKSKS